jgi:hypothetical protein
MINTAKLIVVLFGAFIIVAGFIMLVKPLLARDILKKAASTNLINYTEITLRIIPAIGLIVYAEYSKFSEFIQILGWFMLVTSLILYLVPRRIHHAYSLKCAAILKPIYFQLISPALGTRLSLFIKKLKN